MPGKEGLPGLPGKQVCGCLSMCCSLCCVSQILLSVLLMSFVSQGIVGPSGQPGLKGEQGDSGPPGKVRTCCVHGGASGEEDTQYIFWLVVLGVIQDRE